MSNLFRQEALDAQTHSWMGGVIAIRPVSFTILTSCAVLVGMAIVLFVFFGGYTKRSTVSGQLAPMSGLVQIHSSAQGTVTEVLVNAGQVVKTGDVLYHISTTHHSDSGDSMQAIHTELESRRLALTLEKSQTTQAHTFAIKSMQAQLQRLNSELAQTDNMIAIQNKQAELHKEVLEKYQSILGIGAVSHEAVNAKQGSYLATLETIESHERHRLSLVQQINEQTHAIARLQQEHRTQLSQFDRLLSDNAEQNIQNKARQHIVIKATQDGIVGELLAKVGQYVDTSKPLTSLLPIDEALIAYLYVPSRAIGFINQDSKVLLRYQAYPYQKFGHAKAHITSVAQSATPAHYLSSIGIVSLEAQANNEPIYIVQASLDRQDIAAYGKNLPLKAGMTLEADIMQDHRKLYEWVLEPLYSITGKL
ncbi:MAG: HlyD family efflux transporter periplasmic adaptor subunit [Moraxella sp.]|nr:HlyD family efflux transporter periplasmic adaptor subunit [Moraxella sp.]